MGINWKNKESTDKLIGAMLAAHPSFKPDYGNMALMFGEDATYDSMEGRFRTYRKKAEDLKSQAAKNGIHLNGRSGGKGGGTPRTPRSGGGGICKSSGKKEPSSAANSVKAHFEGTPTKSKKAGLGPGTSQNAAISLDDSDEEEDNARVKNELKKEMEELIYGEGSMKPKTENTRRIRLYDIAPERAQERIDSQSNGYVASPRESDIKSTGNVQVEAEEAEEADTEDDHSLYEEAYEYEDMA